MVPSCGSSAEDGSLAVVATALVLNHLNVTAEKRQRSKNNDAAFKEQEEGGREEEDGGRNDPIL